MSRFKILVSQVDNPIGRSHYEIIEKTFNAEIVFHPFFVTDIIKTKDFRQQKVNIMDYNCVLLRSRKVADFFFEMVQNMRLEIPSSFKYFCYNENVALYLQKYITYRKRRIFFGNNSYEDILPIFEKYKKEKYIIPSSSTKSDNTSRMLKRLKISYTKSVFFEQKNNDLSDINPDVYDIIVFYSPFGVKSFKDNMPNYEKKINTKIACLGKPTKDSLVKIGIKPDIIAGFGKNPLSVTKAIKSYLEEIVTH